MVESVLEKTVGTNGLYYTATAILIVIFTFYEWHINLKMGFWQIPINSYLFFFQVSTENIYILNSLRTICFTFLINGSKEELVIGLEQGSMQELMSRKSEYIKYLVETILWYYRIFFSFHTY